MCACRVGVSLIKAELGVPGKGGGIHVWPDLYVGAQKWVAALCVLIDMLPIGMCLGGVMGGRVYSIGM